MYSFESTKISIWFGASKMRRLNQALEEYENKNNYLLWSSDKRHFPYNCLGLSDKDNSVSRTDNCFQQCYISLCILLGPVYMDKVVPGRRVTRLAEPTSYDCLHE